MAEEREFETAESSETKINNKRLLFYLLFTFVVTYAVEFFMIMPMAGSSDINEAMTAQSLLVSVMLIPAAAALATRLLTKERMIGNNLMLGLNLKGNLKYYGLVWFGFGALVIFGAALYFLIFPQQYDPNMSYAVALLQAQADNLGQEITPQLVRQTMNVQVVTGFLLAPFVNIINCFGEEWGWRGYLLPKLLKRFKVVPAVLLNGLIWGLWHLPLIIMGHNYGVGYPGYPFLGILAMCIFCVVMGTILCYVTIRTQSCIPAILGHGMVNGFGTVGIYYTSLENPYNIFLGPALVGVIGGAGFILLAAVLLFQLYQEEKAK